MTSTDEKDSKSAADYDPRLQKAEKEISDIMKKYDIGGTVAMVSDTHAQFAIRFPDWSLVNFEGDRLRMRTDKDNPELTNQSAHLLFAMRDMLAMQYTGLNEASNKFIEAVESKGGSIDHEPFGGRGISL